MTNPRELKRKFKETDYQPDKRQKTTESSQKTEDNNFFSPGKSATQTTKNVQLSPFLEYFLKLNNSLQSDDHIQKFIDDSIKQFNAKDLDDVFKITFRVINPTDVHHLRRYASDINFVPKLINFIHYYFKQLKGRSTKKDDKVITKDLNMAIQRLIQYIDSGDRVKFIQNLDAAILKDILSYIITVNKNDHFIICNLLNYIGRLRMACLNHYGNPNEFFKDIGMNPSDVATLFANLDGINSHLTELLAKVFWALTALGGVDEQYIAVLNKKDIVHRIDFMAKNIELIKKSKDIENTIAFIALALRIKKKELIFNSESITTILDTVLANEDIDHKVISRIIYLIGIIVTEDPDLITNDDCVYYYEKIINIIISKKLDKIIDVTKLFFNFFMFGQTKNYEFTYHNLPEEKLSRFTKNFKLLIASLAARNDLSLEGYRNIYGGLSLLLETCPFIMHEVDPIAISTLIQNTYKLLVEKIKLLQSKSDDNFREIQTTLMRLTSFIQNCFVLNHRFIKNLDISLIQSILDLYKQVNNNYKMIKLVLMSLIAINKLTVIPFDYKYIEELFKNNIEFPCDKNSVHIAILKASIELSRNHSYLIHTIKPYLLKVLHRINDTDLSFPQAISVLESLSAITKLSSITHPEFYPVILGIMNRFLVQKNIHNKSIKIISQTIILMLSSNVISTNDTNMPFERLIDLAYKLAKDHIENIKKNIHTRTIRELYYLEIVKTWLDLKIIPAPYVVTNVLDVIEEITQTDLPIMPNVLLQGISVLDMLFQNKVINKEKLELYLNKITQKTSTLKAEEVIQVKNFIAELSTKISVKKVSPVEALPQPSSKDEDVIMKDVLQTQPSTSSIDNLSPIISNIDVNVIESTESFYSISATIPVIQPSAKKQKEYDIANPEDIKQLEKDTGNTFVYDTQTNKRRTKVKLCIKPVAILGNQYGVFAKEDIEPSNRLLCVYAGEKVDPNDENQDSDYKFPIFDKSDPEKCITIIDADKLGDFTRYFNHGATPNINCEFRKINYRGKASYVIDFKVVRPIKKGDQLIFDYKDLYFKDLGYDPFSLTEKYNSDTIEDIYNKNKIHYAKTAYQFKKDVSNEIGIADNVNWIVPEAFEAIYQDDHQKLLKLLEEDPGIVDLPMIAFSSDGTISPTRQQPYLTPFGFACALGKIDAVQRMLDFIFAPKNKTSHLQSMVDRPTLCKGQSPLILLMNSHASNEDVMKLLERLLAVDYAQYPLNLTVDRLSLIHYAVKRNSPQMVEKILNVTVELKHDLSDFLFNRGKDSTEHYDFDYSLKKGQLDVLMILLNSMLKNNCLTQGKFFQFINEAKIFSDEILKQTSRTILEEFAKKIKTNSVLNKSELVKILLPRVEKQIDNLKKLESIQTAKKLPETRLFKPTPSWTHESQKFINEVKTLFKNDVSNIFNTNEFLREIARTHRKVNTIEGISLADPQKQSQDIARKLYEKVIKGYKEQLSKESNEAKIKDINKRITRAEAELKAIPQSAAKGAAPNENDNKKNNKLFLTIIDSYVTEIEKLYPKDLAIIYKQIFAGYELAKKTEMKETQRKFVA